MVSASIITPRFWLDQWFYSNRYITCLTANSNRAPASVHRNNLRTSSWSLLEIKNRVLKISADQWYTPTTQLACLTTISAAHSHYFCVLLLPSVTSHLLSHWFHSNQGSALASKRKFTCALFTWGGLFVLPVDAHLICQGRMLVRTDFKIWFNYWLMKSVWKVEKSFTSKDGANFTTLYRRLCEVFVKHSAPFMLDTGSECFWKWGCNTRNNQYSLLLKATNVQSCFMSLMHHY